MRNQEFSHRRCKVTRKPSIIKQNVSFYMCEQCHDLFIKLFDEESDVSVICCGNKVTSLTEKDNNELLENKAEYKILGGHNDNTIEVSWILSKVLKNIKWIYLKTYQGGYLKYIDKSKSKVSFALADDDAFAYCDESPCLECMFWCKRGFCVFLFDEKIGLVKMPIDKANPHWQSK